MRMSYEQGRSEIEEANFAFMRYLVSDTSFSHILINNKESLSVNQHPLEGFKVLCSNNLSFPHLTFLSRAKEIYMKFCLIKCCLLSKKEITRNICGRNEIENLVVD